MPIASVIIPAHNEERTVGRLLSALLDAAGPDEFEILVVCNGCTDATARRARDHGDAVRVIEVDQASKHTALVEGDRCTTLFPRLYVDADVVLDTASARALVAALGEPGVRAVAPERELDLTGASHLVRSYYRVWGQLPAVRGGLYGRGVIGVNAAGYRRLGERPAVLGDDRYLHSRFAGTERRIVADARARVWGPRRTADLVRRRIRTAQGNAELADRFGAGATASGSARAVRALVLAEPTIVPHLPAFLAVTAAGRVGHRRRQRTGRPTEWLRDESSRT